MKRQYPWPVTIAMDALGEMAQREEAELLKKNEILDLARSVRDSGTWQKRSSKYTYTEGAIGSGASWPCTYKGTEFFAHTNNVVELAIRELPGNGEMGTPVPTLLARVPGDDNEEGEPLVYFFPDGRLEVEGVTGRLDETALGHVETLVRFIEGQQNGNA